MGKTRLATVATKTVIDMKRAYISLGVGIAAILLLYFAAPVLPPFLLAAFLAYLVNPLVNRLQRWHIPRTLAVSIILLILFGILVLGVGLLLPVLQEQLTAFIDNLPQFVVWFQQVAVPWLTQYVPADSFTLANINAFITDHWTQAGGYATTAWKALSHSGVAVFTWVLYLILIPLVSFYLLRDNQIMRERVQLLIPRTQLSLVQRILRSCNDMLGAFLRGQLAVIVVMSTLYSLGLALVGLQLALLLGIIAGLMTVIPYIGAFVSIFFACLAALIQFKTLWPLTHVLIVFAIGHMLENFIVTPYLVGDRIGLHPMLVIFVVLIGGQWFGLLGVLLALPVAAILKVLLAELRQYYMSSQFYN